MLFETEKMTRTDPETTLFKIQFNLSAFKNLSKREPNALSDTANNFFQFILAFGNKLKLHNL